MGTFYVTVVVIFPLTASKPDKSGGRFDPVRGIINLPKETLKPIHSLVDLWTIQLPILRKKRNER